MIDRPIHQAIFERAIAAPDAVAATSHDGTLTYGALAARWFRTGDRIELARALRAGSGAPVRVA